MLKYAVKRLVLSLPILLSVSLFCFILVQLAPGDAISSMVPIDATQQMIEEVRKMYGLDRPLPMQYLLWLKNVSLGDLGKSVFSGQPVLNEVASALVNTFRLAITGALLALVLAAVLGTLAAVWRGTLADKAISALAGLGISVPHYWVGMMLVIIFSVNLNLLPAMGSGPEGASAWEWTPAYMRYLILPAVTVAIIPLGIMTRAVRGTVGEILNQEFMVTLKAKNLSRPRIWLHVFRNALPSVLAVVGMEIGSLLGGSILVETVFSWPGTGMLLNNAIFQRDIPVLQGTILILALIFVLLNLTVDLLQSALDPRIRRK